MTEDEARRTADALLDAAHDQALEKAAKVIEAYPFAEPQWAAAIRSLKKAALQ